MRRLPKFKPTEIGILFAAHSKDEIKEELDTLFDEVSSLLKNHKAGNLINIKKLPEHITVNDIELATNIRIKSRCVLLIWGRYEKGPIENKEYKGFLPNKLNFTFITPGSRIGEDMNQDISAGLLDRVFLYQSSNEMIERDFVTKNIADISRYIIGTCLLMFGQLETSKSFFEEIALKPYATWVGKDRQSMSRFVNALKLKLSTIYHLQARDIYIGNIFVDGSLYFDNENLGEFMLLLDTSIKNNPTINAYLLKAIACLLLGKITKSKNIMKHSKQKWPLNPNPDYSLAFLNAHEGDLRKSISHYNRAFKHTTGSDTDIFHLTEFAEAYIEAKPTKYHLHYALGLLYLELSDTSFAIKHFDMFIKIAGKTKSDKDLVWIKKAEDIIKAIQANN